MRALGISFAADWFENILENIAGDTPEQQTPPEPQSPPEPQEQEEEEERPSTDSWERRTSTDTPPPPFDENGEMLPHVYQGRNWQVRRGDVDTETVSVTESRCISTICPYCQTEFEREQMIAKFRCGHTACTDCYEAAVRNNWTRCTVCRRSARARAVHVADDPDVDLSAFIQPPAAAAAAAADPATEEISSSPDSFHGTLWS